MRIVFDYGFVFFYFMLIIMGLWLLRWVLVDVVIVLSLFLNYEVFLIVVFMIEIGGYR